MERLNITLPDGLAEDAKKYAREHNTSVSSLIAGYLQNVLQRPKKKRSLEEIKAELEEEIDPVFLRLRQIPQGPMSFLSDEEYEEEREKILVAKHGPISS